MSTPQPNGDAGENDVSTMAINREELLELIASQLSQLGYRELAGAVAVAVGVNASFVPSGRLWELASLGKTAEEADDDAEGLQLADRDMLDDENDEDALVIDSNVRYEPKMAPSFTCLVTTVHKGSVKSAAFSPDGRYLATGSKDSTSKILDVAKMNASRTEGEERSVLRTLSDHVAAINEVAFHPNGQCLASCSDDRTIKLFDLTKPHNKRAFRFLQDSHSVRSIDFHPSGDFIVAATDHEAPRTYDIASGSCFTPPNGADYHRGPINYVRYSPNGANFVTASDDGSLKIFDVVSGRCVFTWDNAHKSSPVWSCRFTRNSKYVLSTGGDSTVKLWDMGLGRVVKTYEGGSFVTSPITAALSFDENYVFSGDDRTNSVFCWDSRAGGQALRKLSGHSNTVNAIATSPTDLCFVSCGADGRAKYWNQDV